VTSTSTLPAHTSAPEHIEIRSMLPHFHLHFNFVDENSIFLKSNSPEVSVPRGHLGRFRYNDVDDAE
jgi:hypothetical protein